MVRSGSGDETTLTLTASVTLRTATLLGTTIIANMTNGTSAELLIVAIGASLNRSTVACVIPDLNPPSRSLTVFVLGEVDDNSLALHDTI